MTFYTCANQCYLDNELIFYNPNYPARRNNPTVVRLYYELPQEEYNRAGLACSLEGE